MITQSKIRITSLAITFLLVGFPMRSWGQAPGVGVGSIGGELEGAMVVEGRILCDGCSLEEVRKTQPSLLNLYEFSRGQKHLVIKVDEANSAARWEAIVGLSHQVTVRAKDKVWKTLTAEENLFRKVELVGILSSTRTLNVDHVKVGGINISALEDSAGIEQVMAVKDIQKAALLEGITNLQAMTATRYA